MTGRVLRLPGKGRLLVGTDLQGNLADFESLRQRFLASGDDAVLVLTGDLVHGPDELTEQSWPAGLGTPYRDESPKLVEAFIALAERCPGRVWCLLGNHDHAHVGGPVVSKFHDDEAAVLEARLDAAGVQRLRETFAGFPLVAVAPCGVVLLHAAPAVALEGPHSLEELRLDGYRDLAFPDFLQVPVLGPLLWARRATDEQAERFVEALGGEVAIYGHDVARHGFAKDGPRRLRVSTSFGLYDRDKCYVELDLAASYRSVDDFEDGRHLKRLYD